MGSQCEAQKRRELRGLLENKGGQGVGGGGATIGGGGGPGERKKGKMGKRLGTRGGGLRGPGGNRLKGSAEETVE